MSRYIDIEPLMTPDNIVEEREDTGIDELPYKIRYGLNIDVIRNAPTADVVEVRHGEWVVDAYKGDEIVRIPYVVHEHNEPYCSLCGTYALLDGKEDYVPSNFCPRCGAKMDGERREGKQIICE